MEENELYDRIGETDLNPTYKDGQTYQHTDINQMLGILKTAINENYYDIQRLLNGEKTVGNGEKLDGASLSRYRDEELQADDNKVPSSQQAKAYMDALFAGYSAPVRGVDYWTDADKQEIIDDTTNAVVEEITPSLEEVLNAKANINDIPTKISDLQNDSDFLSENNLQMVNTTDIENDSQLTDTTGYCRINKIYGDSLQNGTPTPDNPSDIDVVTGDIELIIKDSSNNQRTTIIPLGNIELCKIGTHQDYIYEKEDGWYLHKEIEKLILNGSEDFIYGYSQGLTDTIRIDLRNVLINSSVVSENKIICDKFISAYGDSADYEHCRNLGSSYPDTLSININKSRLSDISTHDILMQSLRAWLSSNNVTIYYILATPIDIKITDELLLIKLDEKLSLFNGGTIFEISSDGIDPKLNITYAITNRDIYSKEETDDLLDDRIKKINKTIKVHAVAKSSATYIVELSNNKNLIVDTGMASQWTDIKNAIDGLGITKFDYFILTHFHSDHKGNIQNLCDNYDLSNCKCWVQMKPDFINHSEDIDEEESSYDDTLTLLINNNLTPIVPEHNSYFEIDENTKLHFLNTSSEIAENYYGRITEYRTEKKLNFNHFSLITELIFNDKVITFTGDIEKVNEEYMNVYMRKADIITSPHHGVNVAAYKPFYENIKPDYSFNMYISNTNTWVHPYFNSFMYQKELGCRMITPDCTEAINGLYSFIINKIKIQFLNNGDDEIAPGREAPIIYTSFTQIFDRSKILSSEVTLQQIFDAMEPGSTLKIFFWEDYQTAYQALYNDIVSIFPTFTVGLIELNRDINHYRELIIRNKNVVLRARSNSSTFSVDTEYSTGIITDTVNTSNLITKLKKYPIGQYIMNYFGENEDNSVLTANGGYTLNINIINKTNTDLYASIIATLRDTTGSSDVCRVASCYINTTSTPQYKWIKLN